MRLRSSLVLVLIVLVHNVAQSADPYLEDAELEAHSYLEHLNLLKIDWANREAIAEWNYSSNITEHNLLQKLAVQAELATAAKKEWDKVKQINWHQFKKYDLKRQFKSVSKLDTLALPDKKLRRNAKIISDMSKIYSTVKLCRFDDPKQCNLELEPDLTNIMASSRNEEELRHIWIEFRKAIGPNVKHLYKEYVDLQNEAAMLNNFTNNVDMWLDGYEQSDFPEQIQRLWEQLRPLYLQIHAYVRHKLRVKYGNDIVTEKGPIPVHLLGNMWAQSWENIAAETLPYPDKRSSRNITAELLKQNFTAEKIFKAAEEFFVSINLTEMTDTFWNKSILVKAKGRDMVCHASAWDFAIDDDYRIKQCTQVNEESFNVAHHEMGHIEYFMQYRHQPLLYREGANDGFHEAVGDTIALSVSTSKHLKKVGLLKDDHVEDKEEILNNLYKVGLSKIVFLPFAYILDLWRWDIFSGKTTSDSYNCKWWQLRHEYQGVEPPVDRTEDDLDPAAKYHVVSDTPYLRYFISFVIQFQFHRSLCEKAGQYVPNDPTMPLHDCDIYQSQEAGNALRKMLAMGSSKPWPDAMEKLTGQRQMDASALLEYFHPLQKWLEHENVKNGVHIGWEATKTTCGKSKV